MINDDFLCHVFLPVGVCIIEQENGNWEIIRRYLFVPSKYVRHPGAFEIFHPGQLFWCTIWGWEK